MSDRPIRICCPACGFVLGRVTMCADADDPYVDVAAGVPVRTFVVRVRQALLCPRCKSWRELPNQVKRMPC